jgi:hypothetical protein
MVMLGITHLEIGKIKAGHYDTTHQRVAISPRYGLGLLPIIGWYDGLKTAALTELERLGLSTKMLCNRQF